MFRRERAEEAREGREGGNREGRKGGMEEGGRRVGRQAMVWSDLVWRRTRRKMASGRGSPL